MFLFKSSNNKTQALLSEISKDDVCAKILNALSVYGFDITYRFFGKNGTYTPKTVQSNRGIDEDFLKEIQSTLHNGHLKAQIELCSRYGKAHATHTLLHEMIHFYQDMKGLFLTPLEYGTIIQPDLKSHIEITLMCEAMAATEAIRASYRLKQAGHSAAWHGAFWSPNWHDLIKNYTLDMVKGQEETQAAQKLFNTWYQSSQCPYYERQAFESYKNHGQDYRNVNLYELVTTSLGEEIEHFPYLKNITHKTEIDYKHCKDTKWQDITIGAPPYIWNTYLK